MLRILHSGIRVYACIDVCVQIPAAVDIRQYANALKRVCYADMIRPVLTRRNQSFAILVPQHQPIRLFLSDPSTSYFSLETYPMHKTANYLSFFTVLTIIGKDLSPDQRLNFWNCTAESTSSKLNFPPISLLLVLLRSFFFTVLPLRLLSGWTR